MQTNANAKITKRLGANSIPAMVGGQPAGWFFGRGKRSWAGHGRELRRILPRPGLDDPICSRSGDDGSVALLCFQVRAQPANTVRSEREHTIAAVLFRNYRFFAGLLRLYDHKVRRAAPVHE